MKKRTAAGLALCLSLSLVLTACGGEDPEPASSPSASVEAGGGGGLILPGKSPKPDPQPAKTVPPEETVPPSEAPQLWDDDDLEDAVYEQRTIEPYGTPITYTYAVPRLKADTPTAQVLNRRMEEWAAENIAFSLEALDRGEEPPYGDIFWKSSWYGSVVNLLLTMNSSVAPTEYLVVNYDFETGEELDGHALLAELGLDEPAFRENLRRAAAQEFDLSTVNVVPDYAGVADGLNELRAKTISEHNINNSPVCLDWGEPCGIVPIGTPAGAGVYRALLPAKITVTSGTERTSECEFVTASLKDNRVTLTFQETAYSDHYIQGQVEYGVPYEIEGLYGNYRDVEVGIFGQDIFPYVCLVDYDGFVTVCDVISGIHQGGRFTALGPLYGISEVDTCEAVSMEGGQSIEAVHINGEREDLFSAVMQAQFTRHYILAPDAALETRDGQYHLSWDDDNLYPLVWEDDAGGIWRGDLLYLGMTEKGQVYQLSLDVSGADWSKAELIVHTEHYMGTEEWEDYAEVRQTDGEPIPGLAEGSPTSLYTSFGE